MKKITYYVLLVLTLLMPVSLLWFGMIYPQQLSIVMAQAIISALLIQFWSRIKTLKNYTKLSDFLAFILLFSIWQYSYYVWSLNIGIDG